MVRRTGSRAAAWTGLVAVAAVLAGCAAPAKQAALADRAPASPEEQATVEATPTPQPSAWPLTGVPGDVDERAAVSVKVENSPQARPQTGLEDADVVWEELVEGGTTRFNAVFHSRLPDVVGPIRSLRPMDAGITGALGGVLVISGGQPRFLSEVRQAGIQLVSDDDGDGGFFRSQERRSPHNLYGRPEDFLEQADARHDEPPPAQLLFAASADDASAARLGSAATAVDLRFPATNPGWTWDPTAGLWLRDERGVPAITTDGERLGAANVVVLRVRVADTGALDPAGFPVPETVMTGEGEALVAGAGRTIRATWSKRGTAEPLVLTDESGDHVRLAPGITWVELLPVHGSDLIVSR
ncbi:DUF3048 domain-containing protein [Georgenia wangjunii]|uniref:DUF3048 domain-containing protein n=1 Tax=Georgenia wangjunii TaxID=3117730 RepID=UPI002F264735